MVPLTILIGKTFNSKREAFQSLRCNFIRQPSTLIAVEYGTLLSGICEISFEQSTTQGFRHYSRPVFPNAVSRVTGCLNEPVPSTCLKCDALNRKRQVGRVQWRNCRVRRSEKVNLPIGRPRGAMRLISRAIETLTKMFWRGRGRGPGCLGPRCADSGMRHYYDRFIAGRQVAQGMRPFAGSPGSLSRR